MFFPKELEEKIFHFEYTLNKPLTETEKEAGLALTLSKEIIEKNKGTFEINANGNLTEISFTLPLNDKV